MILRNSPIYMYQPEILRASRSAHLYTVPGFLGYFKDICTLQVYLSNLNKKQEFPNEQILVDVDELRKKENEQNKSTYRQLQIVDNDFEIIKEMMQKCRNYYNFLMNTPLKNHIPPGTKIDGRSFNEIENEFMLYYRMVRGVEKAHDVMD